MKNEDFNDIYRKYHRFSVKSAYRLVKDRMLAEDISQEVFYHLYEIMDTLDLGNEEKLRALIFIATVNKTKDYFKKPWKRQEYVVLEEWKRRKTSEEKLNPERIMLDREQIEYRKQVLLKLRRVNPVNYNILIMVKYFGISPDSVAEEYGITRNNVNNRILRTRKWMKQSLKSCIKDIKSYWTIWILHILRSWKQYGEWNPSDCLQTLPFHIYDGLHTDFGLLTEAFRQ